MRTIKFRAWDKRTESLRDVNRIDLDNQSFNLMLLFPAKGAPKNWSLRKFAEVELMQYTNLKDRTGREIYEGDIVKYKSSEQGKQDEFYEQIKTVSFYKGGFGFEDWSTNDNGELRDKCKYQPSHFATRAFYYIDFGIEVIGNIHENPELL